MKHKIADINVHEIEMLLHVCMYVPCILYIVRIATNNAQYIHSFILFPYIPFRYIPWKWKTSHSIYIIRQLANGITSIAKVEEYL